MKNLKKYSIGYYGGESLQHPGKACDYMICVARDEDGRPVETYAEVICPDDVTEDNVDAWSESVYDDLKAEIIEQAKRLGVAAEQLEF